MTTSGTPSEIEADFALILKLGEFIASPAGSQPDGSWTVAGKAAVNHVERIHWEMMDAIGSTPADAAALLRYTRHFLWAALERGGDPAGRLSDVAHLFTALEFTRAGVIPAPQSDPDAAPWRPN